MDRIMIIFGIMATVAVASIIAVFAEAYLAERKSKREFYRAIDVEYEDLCAGHSR